MTDATIELRLPDGTCTGPVPMGVMRDALKVVKSAPMKETTDDRAVRDRAYDVTADELRQFVERYEHLEAEKKDITDQQKEVMAEAKARGYETKALRKIIALRKKDPDQIAEEEAVLDLYKAALGML